MLVAAGHELKQAQSSCVQVREVIVGILIERMVASVCLPPGQRVQRFP